MTLKILFFGLGSIGKKHANLIKKNYEYELFAYRSKLGQEKNDSEIQEVVDLDEAFNKKPDIAFITNPTHLHIKTALECVKRNINFFMEKPISHSLEKTEELQKEIKNKKIFSYIAYNLRFHPVIESIKEIVKENGAPNNFEVKCSSYLPDWRPKQDYTKSYSADKSLGGGVILDLSHEFDYISYLFGQIKDITGYSDKISDLDIKSEDIVDAEIKLSNTSGKLHLDYFTKKPERIVKLHYDKKTIQGDLINNFLVISKKEIEDKIIKYEIKKDETYKKQLNYFFSNYKKGNLKLMNNYSEALKTFKKIIKFKNKYCRI